MPEPDPPQPAPDLPPTGGSPEPGSPLAPGSGHQAYLGGGSAERMADELAAAADPAAAAWAAGAEGERRVAAELAELDEGWTVLHDRLLHPGRSEANLDHVVVGPGGVYFIDAKNRAGRVAAWEGGLFQHVRRDGRNQSLSMAGELKKIHGMAAYMAAELGGAVTPVLCLAGAQEAGFGKPRSLRGVWVVPVSHLVPWLESQPRVLDAEPAARVATRAMTEFPSTTTDPDLLAAIGRAAAQKRLINTVVREGQSSGRVAVVAPPRARRSRAPRAVAVAPMPRRRPSISASFVRFAVGLLGFAVLLTVAAGYVPDLVARAIASVPLPTAASPASGDPAVDCLRLTQGQVASVVGRAVEPVATSTGCAWGTRLDDPTTVVVSVRTSPSHAAYETKLVTSATQHRVVYGQATDLTYHRGTALWVAAGQPINEDASVVPALVDTTVIVSTDLLKVSDDRARSMALAMAGLLNAPR